VKTEPPPPGLQDMHSSADITNGVSLYGLKNFGLGNLEHESRFV